MTAPLEARFRRLLRAYPAAYRRAHGADILSTVLADAASGQRWPHLGDAVNLVFHGLRLRVVTRSRGGLFDAGWADACALLGPLVALVLVALRLPILLRIPPAAAGPPFDASTISSFPELAVGLQVAGWAAVAVAALAGLRRSAALLGWAAVLAEVVPLARLYHIAPVPVVHGLWRPALAVVAAIALTAYGPRTAVTVLGRRRLGTVLVAITVIGVIAVASGPGSVSDPINDGGAYYSFSSFEQGRLIGAGSLLALVVAVLTVPGPIRSRLLTAVAPVITMILLVDQTLGGWAYSNDHMGHPIPLVTEQWVALLGLPLVTLALGLRWVRRRDDLLRLAALGATVEQSEAPGTGR